MGDSGVPADHVLVFVFLTGSAVAAAKIKPRSGTPTSPFGTGCSSEGCPVVSPAAAGQTGALGGGLSRRTATATMCRRIAMRKTP